MKVRDEILPDTNNRAECKDVVILFTDGSPSPGPIDPIQQARDICARDATMLVVGVGQIDEDEQTMLACDISTNVYAYEDFGRLSVAVEVIRQAIYNETCHTCGTTPPIVEIASNGFGSRMEVVDSVLVETRMHNHDATGYDEANEDGES